jgi:hypothetical protein
MLKKSILVLAVLALAMPVLAGDDVATKTEKGSWPAVFEFRVACDKVKVVVNVGYYVNIVKCKKLKIVLDQVNISEYKGCVDFEFENNFELELGASVEPKMDGSSKVLGGDYSAWIEGDKIFPATMGSGKNKSTICVKIKKAKIVKADPKSDLHVATASILVRPTAKPMF